MTAYMYENKIKKVDVQGNGQSIFIVKDEGTNKKIGLNYTECTDLKLYFNKNKLQLVNYEIEPKSITTPYLQIEQDQKYLKGFVWREDERPKQKEEIYQ